MAIIDLEIAGPNVQAVELQVSTETPVIELELSLYIPGAPGENGDGHTHPANVLPILNATTASFTTAKDAKLSGLPLNADLNTRFSDLKSEILGGAGAAFDTLQELKALLDAENTEDATTLSSLLTQIGNKADTARGLPAGGTTGQKLVKLSGTNYDAGWASSEESVRNFMDLLEQLTITAPAAGIMRLEAGNDNGKSVLNAVSSDGFVYRVGRDLVLNVRNSTGADIVKGAALYSNGVFSGTGFLPSVALASASSLSTAPCIGFAAETIANNSVGKCIFQGRLDNINTSAFTSGARVWLSTTAGAITATRPELPNHTQRLGFVLRAHATGGSLLVNIAPLLTELLGSVNPTFRIGGATGASTLDTTGITAPRTHKLPNDSGTLALSENVNVKHLGAKGDGLTDDTAAIQAAIDAVITKGGGVVYFPDGIYRIGGPLITAKGGVNPNSQLVLPPQSIGSQCIPITFRGESVPPTDTGGLSVLPLLTKGAILYSTITGNGTKPAILGGKGHPDAFYQTDFTNLHARLENLTFRVGANIAGAGPTMSGANLECIACAEVESCKADVDTDPWNTVIPTAATFGFYLPKSNNGAWSTISNTFVYGYRYGYILPEHSTGNNVNAMCCFFGAMFPFAHHATSFNRMGMSWNKYTLGFANNLELSSDTGPHYLHISQLDVEHYTNATAKWYQFTADIYDTLNNGRGNVTIHIVKSGVGKVFNELIKTGGTRLNIIQSGEEISMQKQQLAGALQVANLMLNGWHNYTVPTKYDNTLGCARIVQYIDNAANMANNGMEFQMAKPGEGGFFPGLIVACAADGTLEVTIPVRIKMALPTSAAGLPPNALWRNGNVVNIV